MTRGELRCWGDEISGAIERRVLQPAVFYFRVMSMMMQVVEPVA